MVAQQRKNALVFWNEAQANASVERMVDMADIIYPGHDQPFRISANNAVEYVDDFAFGLRRVTADTPGLTFDLQPELTPVIHQAPPGWMHGVA